MKVNVYINLLSNSSNLNVKIYKPFLSLGCQVSEHLEKWDFGDCFQIQRIDEKSNMARLLSLVLLGLKLEYYVR